MPEPKENNNENPPSDDSKKTDKGDQKAFDPKSLGDEDFSKIFDDPRVWQHKRFKELTEAAQELKKLKETEDSRKEKELKEQGKFKELAEKAQQEKEEALKQFQTQKIDNALTLAASKLGVGDLEAALKLVDRSKITIDEASGAIKGAEESMKELVDSKPYLKSETQKVVVGSPSNPTGDGGVKKFTLSQIEDPTFYAEHKDDILKAYKTPGSIIDDKPQK